LVEKIDKTARRGYSVRIVRVLFALYMLGDARQGRDIQM